MPADLAPAQPNPFPPMSTTRSLPNEPLFADAVAGAFMHLRGNVIPWMPFALDYWCESNAEGVTVALLDIVKNLIRWEEGDGKIDPEAPPLHLLYCTVLLSAVGILHLRGIMSDDDIIPDAQTLMVQLDPVFEGCVDLMLRKNHDYGDSWRYMRTVSITDQLLVKILRLQQLEELEAQGQQGQVAEGRESEYRDILNYAILELLRYTTLSQPLPWPMRLHSAPMIPHARG